MTLMLALARSYKHLRQCILWRFQSIWNGGRSRHDMVLWCYVLRRQALWMQRSRLRPPRFSSCSWGFIATCRIACNDLSLQRYTMDPKKARCRTWSPYSVAGWLPAAPEIIQEPTTRSVRVKECFWEWDEELGWGVLTLPPKPAVVSVDVSSDGCHRNMSWPCHS